MDHIEVRVHDEINDYKEKFYGLNIRQWIMLILMCVINVPLYIYAIPHIGADPASYLVIIVALPFAVIGFIPIQQLPAEKILLFIWRFYIHFAKPLHYKTQIEIQAEKEEKRRKQTFKVEENRIIFSMKNLKEKVRIMKEKLKPKKVKKRTESDIMHFQKGNK